MHGGLGGLDLNLLVLFDAVVREGQLSRAAARLGLSPSAASHALARLRQAVGDPLLLRTRGGLALTPRAEALAAAVARALGDLDQAIREPAVFDPATTRRLVRIAASDSFEATLLPNLLAALAREAPGLDLCIVRPSSRGLQRDLETGEIELYHGVLPGRPLFEGLITDPGRAGLKTRAIQEEGWICTVRRGHPRIRGRLSLARYAAEGHIVYSPTGGGPGIVDRELERHGLARRVALRVPSFRTALEAVACTDFLWTGPRAIAAALDRQPALRHVRPPVVLPTYPVHLVWHERLDGEPHHRWLRELMVRVARGGAQRAASRGMLPSP